MVDDDDEVGMLFLRPLEMDRRGESENSFVGLSHPISEDVSRAQK